MEEKNMLVQQGYNAGMILMNLTRMRQTNWTRDNLLLEVNKKRPNDQNEMNEYCSQHSDRIYDLNCKFNSRGFRACSAEKKLVFNKECDIHRTGVTLVHTLGGHAENYVVYRVMIQCFREMNMQHKREKLKARFQKCFSEGLEVGMRENCDQLMSLSLGL